MIYHETTREQRLELALGHALGILIKNEPGNSRAVSDEFVAMASIGADHDNQESLDILLRNKRLEEQAEELYKSYTQLNLTRLNWYELSESTQQMWREAAGKINNA